MPTVALTLIVVGLALIPIDSTLSRWLRALPISNDPARELEFLGQFGQFTSVVVVFVLIALLDPARWRRVFDWAAAGVLVWLLVKSIKILAGRVRPRVEVDPGRFLGSNGSIDLGDGPVRSWDLTAAATADLWSMPSNHAAFAAVLGVTLTALYPRLRAFSVVMVVLVCLARVHSGAHFVSDVLVGAGLGLAIAGPAVRGYWGVRLLDAVWLRLIDPGATPAYPAVRRACEGRDGGGPA